MPQRFRTGNLYFLRFKDHVQDGDGLYMIELPCKVLRVQREYLLVASWRPECYSLEEIDSNVTYWSISRSDIHEARELTLGDHVGKHKGLEYDKKKKSRIKSKEHREQKKVEVRLGREIGSSGSESEKGVG